MKFDVKITVGLKEGMLDPEATTIRSVHLNRCWDPRTAKGSSNQ
jgi:phosphoribosylformylglycinamidine (FGAM) synthase PurS component